MPYVCECGQEFDLITALNALSSDRMGSSGMFCPNCSNCGQSLELRLKNGGFEVGYSYFGGSMHFEAMKQVGVKGLRITPSDPDDLQVVIGERKWQFGIRHISTMRFCVFGQAFACGKRLDELDFAQWEVSMAGMERDHSPCEYSDATVVEANDFIWLTGPSPYLTRAWHYINDGIPRKPNGTEFTAIPG